MFIFRVVYFSVVRYQRITKGVVGICVDDKGQEGVKERRVSVLVEISKKIEYPNESSLILECDYAV